MTYSNRTDDLIVHNMFDGGIITKQHYLEVDFNAQGCNYGFDFEWNKAGERMKIYYHQKYARQCYINMESIFRRM